MVECELYRVSKAYKVILRRLPTRSSVPFYRIYLNLMLWDGGSGYKTYVFKESIRRYAIDRKGRGRKEVIYLRVANISYTRGIYKSTGLLL